MKRGQKVRILRTNEIATIIDMELIRKSGKVHRYCHLKTKKNPDLWLDSEELGGMVEHCHITFQNENGQELIFDVKRDYRKRNVEELGLHITGRNPENLKEHHGLHVAMATLFLENFTTKPASLKARP